MVDEVQKYYVEYEDKEVIIIHEFTHNNIEFAVISGGNGLTVYRKEQLIKWEDTRWARRKAQLHGEIKRLEEEKSERIKQIKKEAVSSLAARLKLNSVFSLKGKNTQLGIAIATEIEKLIEEKSVDFKD